MKGKHFHPSMKGVKNTLFKIFTVFTVVVLICVSVGIFYARDLTLGYKYYELNENSKNILVGVSQQENLIIKTQDKFLEELTDKGYHIVTSSLNTHLLYDKTVIQKSKINDNAIKEKIIDSMEVSVFTTKLKLKDDETVYYFNSENECSKFVNELNQYITQETTIESTIEDYKIITAEIILEQKVEQIKAQKAEIDKKAEEAKIAAAQKAKSYQVTSRGGNVRTSNYKGGAPMASYVYISSYYGARNGGNHTGVDFAASTGTHIYAWKDGTVVYAGWNGSYGNFIEIKHNDGTTSRYAHLSGYATSKGAVVTKGQTIGYVGSTGNSTGPHLHFEIKVNGSFVNPLNYL